MSILQSIYFKLHLKEWVINHAGDKKIAACGRKSNLCELRNKNYTECLFHICVEGIYLYFKRQHWAITDSYQGKVSKDHHFNGYFLPLPYLPLTVFPFCLPPPLCFFLFSILPFFLPPALMHTLPSVLPLLFLLLSNLPSPSLGISKAQGRK